MPTLVTGNKYPSREAGFSLVELLAVLAILSLMMGLVVINLPQPRSDTDRVTEAMAAQITEFLHDGAVAGDMRALGASADGLALFGHDGRTWTQLAVFNWPEAARVSLIQSDERINLPDIAEPTLLFEPYGQVPDFALVLVDQQAEYSLTADERGRIVRTVER